MVERFTVSGSGYGVQDNTTNTVLYYAESRESALAVANMMNYALLLGKLEGSNNEKA